MVSEKECICERGRKMKKKEETSQNMEIGKEFLEQIQENKTEKEYWNQFQAEHIVLYFVCKVLC